jgi:hypothetical protein
MHTPHHDAQHIHFPQGAADDEHHVYLHVRLMRTDANHITRAGAHCAAGA